MHRLGPAGDLYPLPCRHGSANASTRGQRAAILASPPHELTGFYLAVDCLAPRCSGERTFALAELARIYNWDARRSVGFLARSALRRWLPASRYHASTAAELTTATKR